MPTIDRSSRKFRCFCGLCHVVTGTQACLIWYVLSSLLSMIFGMRSTLTWLLVPTAVTALGVYALYTKHHKYLYPFLIITVVQQFVCILMATFVALFSIFSFDVMRQIIGHSLEMVTPPEKSTAVVIVTAVVFVCLLLSAIHVWQAIVIYRCLEYYEEEYRRLEDCREHTGESRTEFSP